MIDPWQELGRVLGRYRRGRCVADYTARLVEGLISKVDQEGRDRVLASLWSGLTTDFQRAVRREPVQNWIFPVTIPCWVRFGDTRVMADRLLSMLNPNEPSVAKAWAMHLSGPLRDALYRHYDRFAQSTIAEIEAWVEELKFAMAAEIDDYKFDPDLVRAVDRIGEIIEDKRSEPRDQALLAASEVTCLQRASSTAVQSRLDRKADIMSSYESDAFISHASEDKESFVTPLVEELQKYGLKVWFDKFSLKVGDSLRRKIEAGLATSRFGIVILSPSFFAKNWPQSELNGLFAREVEGTTVILPIWHQITKQDLLQRAPMLADKKAADSKDGIAAVARELVQVIRPEALELDISRADAQRVNTRLLEQLREKNPGLDFRVSVGSIPAAGSLGQDLALPKGTVASMLHSGMQIDIMAKDREEYRDNPVKFSIRFKDKGITKMKELLRTGKAQEFTSEEFSNVKTNLQLFESFDGHPAGQKLVIAPSKRMMKIVPVRVTFRGESDSDTFQFPYLQMRGERGGTDEVSMEVGGQNVPFLLHVVLPLRESGGANLRVEPHIIGAEVHTVRKYANTMRAMQKGCVIEMFNLETDSLVFSGNCKLEAPTEREDCWFRMVDDVATVADHFGLTVKWPTAVSEHDAELLTYLKCSIDGTPIGKGASFTSTLRKTRENASVFERLTPVVQSLLQMDDPIIFFGTPIEDRALFLFIEKARIVDFEGVRDRFARAAPGEDTKIRYETDSAIMVQVRDKGSLVT